MFIWRTGDFTDQEVWVHRLEHFVPHKLTSEDLTQRKYSATPGTVALLLGHGLWRSGLTALESLQVAVTLLVGTGAAGVAMLAYSLQRDSMWWLAAGIIAGAHPLFLSASPVDAVAAAYVSLAAFLFLYYMQKPSSIGAPRDILLGLVLAVALATRFHLAFLLSTLAVVLLSRIIHWRHILVIVGVAATALFAFNPFLGYTPATYVQVGVFEQLGFFTGTALEGSARPVLGLQSLLHTPFTLLAIALTLVSLMVPTLAKNPPLDRRFLLSLLTLTGAITALLLTSSLQSLRYLFPLMLVWELLLPILLSVLLAHTNIRWSVRESLTVGLTAGSTVFLLLYSITLPTPAVFTDWQRMSSLMRPHDVQLKQTPMVE